MARRFHLVHEDGSEWTREELEEVVRANRRHDRLWPYDATLFAAAVGDDGTPYLLDNCMTWHFPIAGDDMEVVWDD